MTSRTTTAGMRPLWTALVAYALASASLGIVGVVAAVVLYERSGSAAWATVGAAVRVVPFVALSAFAGVLATRRPARSILLAASCAVAAAGAGMVAVATAGPLVAVALVGFGAHAAWTVGYPSMASMVPRLVPPDGLASANGVMSTVESLAWIAGPGLGGAAIAVFGVRPAAAIGVACALAAAVIWTQVPAVPPMPAARTGVVRVIRDGVAHLRSPSLRGVVALQLASNLVYGALSVLLVIAATDRLGFQQGGYGVLTAAMAAGSFVALVVVRRLGRMLRPVVPLAVSVLLAGMPIGVLALVQAPAPAIVLVAVSGLGAVLVEVMALTILQRELPTSALAPVLGLLDSVAIGTIALGAVAAGPLVATAGLERSLVIVGAVVPALAVLLLPAIRFRWNEPVSLLGVGQLGVAVPMLIAARPAGSSRDLPGAVHGDVPRSFVDEVEPVTPDGATGVTAEAPTGQEPTGQEPTAEVTTAEEPTGQEPTGVTTAASPTPEPGEIDVVPTPQAGSDGGSGLVDPFAEIDDARLVRPTPTSTADGAVHDDLSDDLFDDIAGGPLPPNADATSTRSDSVETGDAARWSDPPAAVASDDVETVPSPDVWSDVSSDVSIDLTSDPVDDQRSHAGSDVAHGADDDDADDADTVEG